MLRGEGMWRVEEHLENLGINTTSRWRIYTHLENSLTITFGESIPIVYELSKHLEKREMRGMKRWMRWENDGKNKSAEIRAHLHWVSQDEKGAEISCWEFACSYFFGQKRQSIFNY